VRDDAWLAERLGRPVLTFEPGDDPAGVARAAARRAPAFAQAKVATADVATTAALEDAGFRVVDVNVTLSRPGGGVAMPADVGAAVEADREVVLEIAGRHYDVSRFHRDPAIPARTANAIKRDWAAAYLDGRRGERMLVVRRAGRAVGFLAVLAPSPEVRVIDLVAVHPEARGAGAGRALVEALLSGSDGRVDVGTQIANTVALRFYERLGFRVSDTRYVLHLHA
jgi:ribosomal protein S18 acetylase RimI-like enzyme